MPLQHINFLDRDVPLPLRFATLLPFGAEDRRELPWLQQEIRYYGIRQELKKGGRAVAYRGYVCDAQGNAYDNAPDIVLKLPNIDTKEYDSDQIHTYLGRLRDEGGREWQLTRSRLSGCPFANAIFDFSVVADMDYLGELVPLPVTAQLFLKDTLALDDYLVEIGERQHPYKSKRGVPVDNWSGMSNPGAWIRIARGIAIGLADIHLRRIVHGDIWPPNIFVRPTLTGTDPHAIFIDFGESFPIEPKGDSHDQRDHAYRAPERRDAHSIVTEQSDVYSFGKLLLHLATGAEPTLSNQYGGHARRAIIREKFAKRNSALLMENPFIIDLICKCVALDPVDRPRMFEVVRGLQSYVDRDSVKAGRALTVPEQLRELESVWEGVSADLRGRNIGVNPHLGEVFAQKVEELKWMLKGLAKDVIDLSGTREDLILLLLGLFEKLGKGDRFLSITSPHLWQGRALGLDGRYFTATALAAERGASIQRGVVFSIQEVGYDWTVRLCERLKELRAKKLDGSNAKAADQLIKALASQAKKFRGECDVAEVAELSDSVQREARERLALVMQAYLVIQEGICKDSFFEGAYESCEECDGLYLGLMPVSTMSAMSALKAAHPVSVFYFHDAAKEDQYLLMMTDCAGRNPAVPARDVDGALGSIGSLASHSKPELKGVRVFRSVLGVPEDRIKRLEKRMRQSISVGGWLNVLSSAMQDADR